jgi:uncharacterized protein YrzB (UPF0473 family)
MKNDESLPKTDSDSVVVLKDEEGREFSFQILFDSLFVGDQQYVVLMPVDQEDSMDPEIVILRVDTLEDGDAVLSTIDDDDEWEEVLKAFEEMDIEENLGEYDIEFDEYEEEDEE